MIKKSLLILSSFLIAACAANRGPEPLRFDETKDWIEKSALTVANPEEVEGAKASGRSTVERSLYVFKNTIVRTSSNGGFGFMGLQSDIKLGYFDFTEHNMQFKTLEGVYAGQESPNVVNRVIVQWPATHHDVRLDESEGRVTNREIDDNFKRWDQKKYINVNLNEPSIGEEQTLPYSPAIATTLQCWTLASRERIRNSMVLEDDGYFSFLVEAVYKQNPLCAQKLSQFHDGDFTYTVHYRYSFRRYKPSADYKIFEYMGGELDPARYRYGYFQTVKPEADSSLPGVRKNRFFANRWNPNQSHTFYFAEGTPEKYKPLFKDIFAQTNTILEKTGKAIRFDVKDHDHDGTVRHFGDLRYSFINIVDELDPSSPLGYGPSDADPLTGEIIAANTIIWTGSLDYYLVRLQTIAEKEPGQFENESLYQKMTQALEMEPDQWKTKWDMQGTELGKAYQKLIADTTFNVGRNPYTFHTGVAQVPGIMLYPSTRDQENPETSSEILADLSSVIDLDTVIGVQLAKHNQESTLNGHVHKSFIYSNVFADKEDKAMQDMLTSVKERQSGIDFSVMSEAIEKDVNERALFVDLNQKGHCIFPMEAAVAGGQKLFLDGRTREQIIETIVYRVGIHEFGHNLNLRHNFYGTVDNANFRLHEDPETRQHLEEVNLTSEELALHDPSKFIQAGGKLYWAQNSSSVMDYLRLEHEDHTPRTWEDYDRAAIFYAYSGGEELEEGRRYLFCTDEHTAVSALCNRFDLGSTPSQVVMSIIEGYESSYALNNYRNERSFWDTSSYAGRVFGTMWSIKEFYAMWRAAFAQDIVVNSLGEIGITDSREVEELYESFNREMKKTVMLSMAFYQSVIQQSAVDKPFRSVFDVDTGALMRLGIGIDKQFAMFFLAGDDSFPYHPNRYMIHQSYLSHMFDSGMAKFMHKIWENVVTVRVDMEQGFISYGRGLYARAAKNFYNRSTDEYLRRLYVERYENHADMFRELGLRLPAEKNGAEMTVPGVSNIDNVCSAGPVSEKCSLNRNFKVGEKVVVVHNEDGFYVVSKSSSPYAYTIANSVLSKINSNSSTVQDKIDLKELLRLSRR